MLPKLLIILFCSFVFLSSETIFADERSEKLLKKVEDNMKQIKILSGDYETIRRHLDPPDEIRERGQFRLLKPNYISIKGANFLPAKTAGKFNRVSDSTGYISNGKNFYMLYSQPEGLSYKEALADQAGKNFAFDLPPVADFFDETKSLLKQVLEARRKNHLTMLRYVGKKNWEDRDFDVVEFTTDEPVDGVNQHSITEIFIGADNIVRRLMVNEKIGDLELQSETILRNVAPESNLTPADFAYTLPATAKVYVSPPAPLANGTIAPDVTLVDNRTGAPVKLSDFRGKTVVLDFWATWCVPCLKSFPHTDEAAKKFKDGSVVVLAINIWDGAESRKNWLARNDNRFQTFKFVADMENAGQNSSTAVFRVGTLPLQYVISPSGKIVASLTGYLAASERLEKILKSAEKF